MCRVIISRVLSVVSNMTVNKQLPSVVPPRSVFRLVKADRRTPCWRGLEGTVFRIGYYTKNDGLDLIWLVDQDGEYVQTTDRKALIEYFELISISNESDYFGLNRRRIGKYRKEKG